MTQSPKVSFRRSLLGAAFFCAAAAVLAAPPASKTNVDSEPPAPVKRNEILAQLVSGAFADSIAAKYGLAVVGTLKSSSDWVIFSAYSVKDAVEIESKLVKDPLVKVAANNSFILVEKCQAFTPNDPFFPFNQPVGYPGQSYLAPNASNFLSINAQAAWSLGARGTGVVVGIVDDGFQHTHPDLAPAYSPANSFDFDQNDADPMPVNATDNHGTTVAGFVAARGGNSLGITGAAPNALLAGLRCNLGAGATSAMFADATLYKSSGAIANRTIGIKVHGYQLQYHNLEVPVEAAALTSSVGAGTIHVLAAGNRRAATKLGEGEVTRYQLQGSQDAIVVASLNNSGTFAAYSGGGVNLMVSAPGGDTGGTLTSTDRTGADGFNTMVDDPFVDEAYTSTFKGTSASAGLVAGSLALVKERVPTLNTRLAKYLLAASSKVVDPWDSSVTSEGGWKRNGAGYMFNRNYGFGLLHTGDLLKAAKNLYSVSPRSVRTIGPIPVNSAVPDNNPAGVVRTFTTGASYGIEEVSLRIRATHDYRGDFSVWLKSPYGTVQRMVSSMIDSRDNLDWKFVSNGFWGENALGTWTITVADTEVADTGVWTDYTVEINTGGVVSKLGSNVLSVNAAGNMQMNSLVNGKPFANVALPTTGAGFTPKAVGDIDRDGRNDIVTQSGVNVSAHTMFNYSPKGVVAMGALAANRIVIAVADVNKDGFQDVCWRNDVTREVGYHNLNVNGTLGAAVVIGVAPVGHVAKGVADFTGDGQVDILLDKTTVARSFILWQLSPGGAPFGFFFAGYQATGFDLLGVGDINFDGQPDFLARNTTNGSAACYTMNILTVTTVSTLTTLPAGHTPVCFAAL